MNDRYLFRGKLINNGQWAYGNLSVKPNGCYIITLDDTPIGQYGQVILETVGQCTGLKDKNGKLIFEEDIAKFKRFENNHIGKIIFNHNTAGFEFWWNVVAGTYGEKATYNANLSVCGEIEVIGNIHDNPELLEVDK